MAKWANKHQDQLPLTIAAGVILCFALHYGGERLQGDRSRDLAPAAAVSLSAASAAGGVAADRGSLRRSGEAVELEVCNRMHLAKAYVAVAYYDQVLQDWVTRGWFAAEPGACQVSLRHLTPPIFVYAESKDGQRQWRDEFGPSFCLNGAEPFVVSQKHCETASGPMRRASFHALTVDGKAVRQTWELSE